jgi:Leucine-rich repeat (LRR) protein
VLRLNWIAEMMCVLTLQELPAELANNGHLCILDLGSNNLSTWNSLQVVKSLPSLTNLNLHGNPICSVSEYEKEV